MSTRFKLSSFFCGLLLVGLIVGCATTVKTGTDYYELCKANDTCYAEMVKYGNISKAVVSTATSGTSFSDVLGAIAYSLGSGLAGVFLGWKLKKSS